jgi:hypothetical protein
LSWSLLFRLAAGKLHANYGSELKRLLYRQFLIYETEMWRLNETDKTIFQQATANYFGFMDFPFFIPILY